MSTIALTLPHPVEHAGTMRDSGGRLTSNPRGRQGRPFHITTPLGKIMDERGLKVYEVVNGAHMNPRTMSDYLSGRKPIRPQDAVRLAEFLGVQLEDLT